MNYKNNKKKNISEEDFEIEPLSPLNTTQLLAEEDTQFVESGY